ncbi:MAG: RIP metalloprotease RseP [Alphaproteobacteria bacterium]|nr:MAG: RIP metalloprotease RseP [Alphaproteobacteria bacterium]TAF14256.1 MAG: RIP metalloprotease RseP [Alphaproteobacteria bacterium]TAF41913.1 MAG: RIP metalloprotease RseP [Alphaproteobacteria bacterium]TAF76784.1 MAG: RIP metalloprotease RseP [Alphaproteobacteria bacterium]
MEQFFSLGHTALSFFLIISVIVFIHEFGHYLAARLCGVKIEAFAIGFGKEILGWTDRTGTRWKICLAPLGGYVKMYGDSTEASTPDVDAMRTMTEEERRISFHHKALWQKAIIVSAGPIANFLLAISIFTFLIFSSGLDTTEPLVGKVMEHSAAAEAGIREGDRIAAINDEEVNAFRDISMILATNLGVEVRVHIVREGQPLILHVTPRITVEDDGLGNKVERAMLGISSPKLTAENVSLFGAINESVKRTYSMIVMSLEFLRQVVSGERSAEQLKGPIGIADMSGKVAKKDGMTILWFMALLSVNLGFMNILPIPPLDGGHLLFYTLEGLRGRPMAEQFQTWGYRIGFFLIMALMGFTLFNDMRQIIFS